MLGVECSVYDDAGRRECLKQTLAPEFLGDGYRHRSLGCTPVLLSHSFSGCHLEICIISTFSGDAFHVLKLEIIGLRSSSSGAPNASDQWISVGCVVRKYLNFCLPCFI